MHLNQEEVKKSLNIAKYASFFGNVFFVTVSGIPFMFFTRSIGTNDIIYSVLYGMPFVGTAFQIFATYILQNTKKRKLLFIIGSIIQRVIWIPIVCIPFVFTEEDKFLGVILIAILITIYSMLSSFLVILYLAWIGELIPDNEKGSFFSAKVFFGTISGVITGILSAFVLENYESMEALLIIFITASIFGVLEVIMYIWVVEPNTEQNIKAEKVPFLKSIAEPVLNIKYLKFIIFVTLFSFSINLAGPFYNTYMLEELGLSFFTMFIYIQVVGGFTTIIFANYIGKLIDNFGNKPVLIIGCFIMTILPLVWSIVDMNNCYIFLLAIYIINGIVNPTFFITTTSLSMTLAPIENRSMFIAVQTAIMQLIGMALSFFAGGCFMQYAKVLAGYLNETIFGDDILDRYQLLFVSVSILSLTVVKFGKLLIEEKDSKSVRTVLRSIFTNNSI